MEFNFAHERVKMGGWAIFRQDFCPF